jgi:N-acetylglucosaminyldiphosphoundecaprenol N-acetyl-beta-D-mannosaminyltransferase
VVDDTPKRMNAPDRVEVVGIPISVTSSDELLALLASRPTDAATVVAFCNVHSVMTARHDPEVATALLDADVAAPDGVPVVWGLRAAGHTSQARVDGPSFMQRALTEGVAYGWRHFFWGSTDETLDRLVDATRTLAPGAIVAGVHSPPFGPVADDDPRSVASRINDTGADLVWVGLGMPKQELWMARVRRLLPGVALLGVGAAFDFLAGTSSRAPDWMQRAGLEWVYRLCREPRRLWRRYLFNNPAYLGLLTQDVLRRRLRQRQLRAPARR